MNKGESSISSNKLERKTIEKNRRVRMQNLCNELVSIIPTQHFKPTKEFLSKQDQIEQATQYIKILRERIEELKRKKTELPVIMKAQERSNDGVNMGGSKLPILKIRESGPTLEVVIISGIRKRFMLSQVIGIIEEEGAEVVTANFSNSGDKIFHNVHAKVKVSRIGMDTMGIAEKIQELI